jgi:hypothetical protein
MTIASVLLSFSVHKLRKENSSEDHGFISLSKEIRLTITSISLNIFYIVLTLPLPGILIFGKYASDSMLFFNFFLFCLSYAINFYLLLLMNSLFRNEFIIVLVCKNTINNHDDIILFNFN